MSNQFQNGLQFDSSGNLLVTFAGAVGGAGISAGTNSQNTGTVVFSNSNGVTFGLNTNGVLTATVTPGAAAGIAAVQVSNTTYTSGTVVFSNSNGISFGSTAGGGVTASYTVPGATVFSNSNNVSFGLNGSTVTATATFAGGGAAISAAGSSQNAGTIVFSNANGLAFGMNGSTVTGSYTQAAQTNQTVGLYASSQTTGQSSSSTIDARSLTVVGAGNISAGLSAGSLVISGAAGGQTNQTLGIYGSSQTTGQSSSSTVDARSLSIVGAGAISVGLSGGSFLVSAPQTTSFTPFQEGLSNSGNTSGNTGTVSGQVLWFGTNGITLSGSTNAGSMSITISGVTGGAGGAGISAGTQSTNGGTVVFSNSNNVSFGMSNSSIVTASFSATQVSSVGMYALGNTTQNSSTTLDQRTLSFNAIGGITAGFSNGSIQLSAPATSSLSATGAVSISTNGSTISIGAPNYGTMSYWDNDVSQASIAATQLGVGSVFLQQISMPANAVISALREYVSGSFSSSSNSSYAGTVSMRAGLYTLNGSTLSLATSGSQTYAFTNTSNNSTASLSGVRGMTLPLAATLTPGNYWLGIWSSTASANANWYTLSNVYQTVAGLSFSGLFGAAANASNQLVLGQGIFSTTSTNLPASIALAAITGSGANSQPLINLYNVSA